MRLPITRPLFLPDILPRRDLPGDATPNGKGFFPHFGTFPCPLGKYQKRREGEKRGKRNNIRPSHTTIPPVEKSALPVPPASVCSGGGEGVRCRALIRLLEERDGAHATGPQKLGQKWYILYMPRRWLALVCRWSVRLRQGGAGKRY